PSFDVIWHDEAALVALKASNVLEKYEPISAKTISPEQVIDPNYYVQAPLHPVVYGLVWNTKLVKPEDAPKNVWDIYNNPGKWAGKIAHGDPSRHTGTTRWLTALRGF